MEKELKKIDNLKLELQLRTVAQNGKSSKPSAIYKIQVNEPKDLTNFF